MKTRRIGIRLIVDMAKTYPHWVNWCWPKKPAIAMGKVLRLLSLMTVLAQGYSSQAVRKLKIETDANAGLAKGRAIPWK